MSPYGANGVLGRMCVPRWNRGSAVGGHLDHATPVIRVALLKGAKRVLDRRFARKVKHHTVLVISIATNLDPYAIFDVDAVRIRTGRSVTLLASISLSDNWSSANGPSEKVPSPGPKFTASVHPRLRRGAETPWRGSGTGSPHAHY